MTNEGGQPEQIDDWNIVKKEPLVLDKSAIVKLTYDVYSEDKSIQIAQILGLPLSVIMLAKILQDKVIDSPMWDCKRSPHSLYIDCIYVIAKRKGVKITSRGIASLTKEAFGIGTQPRPNEWLSVFEPIVNEVLQ
tara:strand:- start:19 stop:423 length:405 start_codon:yes stop_codon:yes gene_type:complete